MRHKIISAAYYVQYRYKKYVRNKMLMKAMRFWKLGTEHHYFDTWVRWTEKTVATRQTINARAQERKANFFARHMFEKDLDDTDTSCMVKMGKRYGNGKTFGKQQNGSCYGIF